MNVALWGVQGFLAVVFFLGATVRATRYDLARSRMAWVAAVPRWLLLFISAAEILGAVGLILPGLVGSTVPFTPLAAASLGLVMVLAVLFHLARGERRNAIGNLVLLSLAVVIAAGRLFFAPPALAAAADLQDGRAVIEQGRIAGWQGGDAAIYATVGFFGAPRVVGVGSVTSDGSFSVSLPDEVPADLLGKSTDQCPTIQTSDADALSNFTGNYLVFQQGQQIGATHSASSAGFASFSGFTDGDTRTGLFYADRDLRLSGFCERQLTFGSNAIDFRQNFDITAHKGWNEVVAVLSVPQPGQVIATLRAGSGAMEQWFLF
jgi:DoxX-like family